MLQGCSPQVDPDSLMQVLTVALSEMAASRGSWGAAQCELGAAECRDP